MKMNAKGARKKKEKKPGQGVLQPSMHVHPEFLRAMFLSQEEKKKKTTQPPEANDKFLRK